MTERPPCLQVRNWERYQYPLQHADKRRRISFEIRSALLDADFQGRGGLILLGQWIKVIAWAGQLGNELPSAEGWWRRHFGSSGPALRARLIKERWLETTGATGDDSACRVTACDSAIGDQDLPSDVPSQLPSDVPSDVPSDGNHLDEEPRRSPCKGEVIPLSTGVDNRVDSRVDSLPDLEVEVKKPQKTTSSSASSGLSVNGLPVRANSILAAFIDETRARGSNLSRRVIGQFAQAIKTLIEEGEEPEAIIAGLGRMLDRSVIRPALLGNFVTEARLPRPRSTARAFGYGVLPSEILAAADKLEREERENEQT